MVGMTSECTWGQCVNETQVEESGKHKSVTCILVPTAQDKIDHFPSVECVFPIHDAQGSETPVDRVQAQMSGHMIGKIVFVLCSLQSKCEKIEICLWGRTSPRDWI